MEHQVVVVGVDGSRPATPRCGGHWRTRRYRRPGACGRLLDADSGQKVGSRSHRWARTTTAEQ